MKLVVVTKAGGVPGRTHEDVVFASLEGGCRAIQLRDKEMSDREFGEVAERIAKKCRKEESLFFVNDRVDVALAVGADGVHLGVEDFQVELARKILPSEAIIGYSPDSPHDAIRAIKQGADYLGIGPVYGTRTKSDAGEPIGIDGLKDYLLSTSAPIVAVGGISAANAGEILDTGAMGVAVCSAVADAEDMRRAVSEMLSSLRM